MPPGLMQTPATSSLRRWPHDSKSMPRVRIVRGGLPLAPWKPGATGRVASIVKGQDTPGRGTIHRVEFDKPQLDEECDGPNIAAEIPVRHLRPLR